jgi:hypothetical protein
MARLLCTHKQHKHGPTRARLGSHSWAPCACSRPQRATLRAREGPRRLSPQPWGGGLGTAASGRGGGVGTRGNNAGMGDEWKHICPFSRCGFGVAVCVYSLPASLGRGGGWTSGCVTVDHLVPSGFTKLSHVAPVLYSSFHVQASEAPFHRTPLFPNKSPTLPHLLSHPRAEHSRDPPFCREVQKERSPGGGDHRPGLPIRGGGAGKPG